MNSTTRTPAQTQIGIGYTENPIDFYTRIFRNVSAAYNLSLEENARYFALLHLAYADALISIMDSKYHFNFWRPYTAIHAGDTDGNPITDPDLNWVPLRVTPPHPEYPCAHCIKAGAAAAVIEVVLGSKMIPEVSMTSSTAQGVTHRWTSLDAFCDEVANARIWAGFHYRFSTVVGTEMGRRVGEHVVQNVMQPTSHPAIVSGKR
jgi:hypothetical protein